MLNVNAITSIIPQTEMYWFWKKKYFLPTLAIGGSFRNDQMILSSAYQFEIAASNHWFFKLDTKYFFAVYLEITNQTHSSAPNIRHSIVGSKVLWYFCHRSFHLHIQKFLDFLCTDRFYIEGESYCGVLISIAQILKSQGPLLNNCSSWSRTVEILDLNFH